MKSKNVSYVNISFLLLATKRRNLRCSENSMMSNKVKGLPMISSKRHKCSYVGGISMANILLLRYVRYHGYLEGIVKRVYQLADLQ